VKKPAPVAEQAPADEVEERKPNTDTSIPAPAPNQLSRSGFLIPLPPSGKTWPEQLAAALAASNGGFLFQIGIDTAGKFFRRMTGDGRWLQ
jgi:hypothetical protein